MGHARGTQGARSRGVSFASDHWLGPGEHQFDRGLGTVSLSEMDAKAIRLALENDGYFVARAVVPPEMCAAVLDAAADLGVSVDEPSSWDLVSPEVDQLPIWGHQSQWDIRSLPQLHELWTTAWGTRRLWVSRDSMRFTPPWREGRAEPLAIHFDGDPRDREWLWFQGFVALTPAPAGAGGFRCVPALLHNWDRWPTTWTERDYGTEYLPDVIDEEVVEIPLDVGDVIVWSSHLPHGTVRNESDRPRVAFYLQYFPEGSPEERATRVQEHRNGVAPEWWRWKPGHDRPEPWPPARLNQLGKRLLGQEPWPPQ